MKLPMKIFLPPIAVFKEQGASAAFLANIALTLLGVVPGIMHALWITSQRSADGSTLSEPIPNLNVSQIFS